MNPFRKRVKYLQTDESKAAREYSRAMMKAEKKLDKRTLGSIRKDEVEHKGKLGRILQRMRA